MWAEFLKEGQAKDSFESFEFKDSITKETSGMQILTLHLWFGFEKRLERYQFKKRYCG